MLRGHDDDTPRKVADRDGLSVLWRNSGKVSFVYRYRIVGKAKNLTLGSYTGQEGGLSLSEARKKAAQCRAWLEEGNDPALMTRIGKDERLKPVTVKDALEYWLCHHADKKRSNSEKHRQQFAKWVYSIWQNPASKFIASMCTASGSSTRNSNASRWCRSSATDPPV
ncbi:Arm DNA-binding domain-containing protein [Aeromonas sp. 19NY04SH05-1]|uniref:Arm DNA-binding domain-containing protein n=2 Tax=Aeromonas TaxID=642 RepID=A0AAU6TDV0_9GAMM